MNEIAELLNSARQTVVRAVNQTMVHTYYEIGRMIMEEKKGFVQKELKLLRVLAPNHRSETAIQPEKNCPKLMKKSLIISNIFAANIGTKNKADK